MPKSHKSPFPRGFSSLISVSLLSAAALASSVAVAQTGRSDYDVNKNGLIEIHSVEDFLAIRDSAVKARLYGESTGCPTNGCIGYELMADLDFADLEPSVTLSAPSFIGIVFEGNHHTLRNLDARLFWGGNTGLFSSVHSSTIRNLRIENIQISTSGDSYVGSITPLLRESTLVNVRVSGDLKGWHYTGGLAGIAINSLIIDSHFTGTIDPDFVGASLGKGGLVGSAQHVTVYASSATGGFKWHAPLQSNFELGGLLGSAHSGNTIIASYARFDNISVNSIGNLAATPMGVTIESSYAIPQADPQLILGEPVDAAQTAFIQFYSPGAANHLRKVRVVDLACPQLETGNRCAIPELFIGWFAHKDSQGRNVWRLGNSLTLPHIATDLVWDLTDSDGDGIPDFLDRFPHNAAAAEDFDRDGKPDRWNPNCDSECQANSGLVLDDDIQYEPLVSQPIAEASPRAGAISFFFLCCMLIGCLIGYSKAINAALSFCSRAIFMRK